MRLGHGAARLPAQLGRELGTSCIGLALLGSEHGHKAAVAPNLHALTQRRDSLCWPMRQGRIHGGRAKHPAVQHAWQAQVGNEPGVAKDLVGQVQPGWPGLAHQAPVLRRFGLGRERAFDVQVNALEQAGVMAQLGALGRVKHALANADGAPLMARHFGRALQGQGPHFGTGLAQGAAAVLHRQAARGDALVRPVGGVGAVHAHSRPRHIQLLGHDELQSRQDALPQFHLANEDLHLAGLAQIQPLGQAAVGVQAAWQLRAAVLPVNDKTTDGRGVGGGHGQVVGVRQARQRAHTSRQKASGREGLRKLKAHRL